MIQKISFGENSTKTKKTYDNQEYKKNFLKQTKTSIPMLLSLTAVKSILDSENKDLPVQTVFAKNLVAYFTPVLIISSLALSAIECGKDKE